MSLWDQVAISPWVTPTAAAFWAALLQQSNHVATGIKNRISPNQPNENSPLADLDEWEDDLLRRYPEPKSADDGSEKSDFTDPEKKKDEFRNYEAEARDSVKEFYRLNHRYQCVDFVKQKHDEYLSLNRGKKSTYLLKVE